MTRLIDADNLIRLFKDISNRIKKMRGDGKCFFTVDSALKIIDQAPTVDAVPVIRCKDCKYYREGEYFENTKFCFRLKHGEEYVGYNFSEDDFCSHAERR